MKLNLFNYNLSKEMIATEPASPRDAARLFVYDRLNKKCIHSVFNRIGDYFQKGDVLVLNNTKVIPARLAGRLVHDDGIRGRRFKILLLEKKISPRPSFLKRGENWKCLIDGKGRKEGLKIVFGKGLRGKILKRLSGGIWEIKFNKSGKALEGLINKLGMMPLPPYIKPHFALRASRGRQDKIWYQTVFAKYSGSVAAPTAGLHFTNKLLAKLKKQGVKVEYVTLHVGMGTFMPVKTEKIEEHKMHKELAIISKKTAKVLNQAKKQGRKIIACGTTAARTLESFVVAGKIRAGKKYTNIFIYPPYKFKFISALITNFHLPKSTLLMMVSALLSEGDTRGIKKKRELYAEAIKKKYRFYSYGDAMLIL